MSGAYSTIGPYTHGIWLVSKNGKGTLVDRAHLPAQGQGFKYYWLGATPDQVPDRLSSAIDKLGVQQAQGWSTTDIQHAFAGHPAFLSDTNPLIGVILAGYGAAATIGAGLAAGAGGAVQSGEAGAGAAAAEGGAAGGGASAAAKAAANAAGAAKGIIGGLTVASLFTNTSLWAGIGMTLLGAFLVLFGIIKLSGADPKQLAKQVAR